MSPIAALIIANIIWGAASPIFKFSLQNIPPFTLAFIRFFSAGIFFIPFLFRYTKRITIKDLVLMCLGGFFGITINISFFFLGLEKGVSINAPIIGSAGPIVIYLFSIFYFHERPKRHVFTGMMLALLGVLIIIFSPILIRFIVFSASPEPQYIGEMRSNIFFVLATLGAVIAPFMLKNVVKRTDAYVTTCVSFLFGAVTFAPFMMQELTHWSFNQLNFQGWIGIIFGVFFSSATAYLLYNWAVAKIKTQEIGIFSYIDPVIAVLIAVPLLGEVPTVFFFIGSALVVGGIYIAERRVHWHPIFLSSPRRRRSMDSRLHGND